MKTSSRTNPAQDLTENNLREIQIWPIDKFVLYVRSPRKNDAAVTSALEFPSKSTVLADKIANTPTLSASMLA